MTTTVLSDGTVTDDFGNGTFATWNIADRVDFNADMSRADMLAAADELDQVDPADDPDAAGVARAWRLLAELRHPEDS